MRFSGMMIALLVVAAPDLSQADDGKAFYVSYCSSCHGTSGKGDGKMAALLETEVADLTSLSKGNGGAFPMARVTRRIDGREPVESHGVPRPLWSKLFNAAAPATVETDEGHLDVDPKALEVVEWIRSIQK